MRAIDRFLVVLGVMLLGLVLKWFVPRYVATKQMEKLCQKLLRTKPKPATFGRLFRSLGWDIVNAALGLIVLACIVENSNLRSICAKNAGIYDFVFAITCFMIYVVLYGIAADCRYIFLEAAERVGCRRWSTGLVLWLVGLAMLLNSSWFVAGE